MRSDIRGLDRCPSDVSEYLENVGGTTLFGEPMWRLVVASSVVWKVRGGKTWNKSLTTAERGGYDLENGTAHENRPDRDDADKLVEQLRYPYLEGWILQKWFPPSSYGKEFWFAPENCFPDGTPHLGPYPDRGDYEVMGNPSLQMPTKETLRQFISNYGRELCGRSNIETRQREMANAAEYAEQKHVADTRTFVDDVIKDRCAYLTSNTLTAGRIRTKRAEAAGIFTHVGN